MLGLCERFGCLPSALEAEDGELVRMLQVEALGRRDQPDVGDPLEAARAAQAAHGLREVS